MNAKLMSIGGVPDSEQSKDFRKAFATIFAVYRDRAVDSYYGDIATVVNYPISNTSWAAPMPTDDGYAVLNLFTDLTNYMPNSYNPNDAISLTNAFVKARLDRHRAEDPSWWQESECDLCQAWGKITAAKDNWCKNTYDVLNPAGKITMYRDDDDTIFDKDNVGKTGTPYQVEEHDRYNDAGEWADADGFGEEWNEETGQYNTVEDPRNTYFNSQDSVLFTLREKTRPELKAMVGTIFQAMVQLVGSVEAFFQKI